MKFSMDHDLHIHSQLSLCSNDPMQTTESILEYAKRNNLKSICLTDHFWDERISDPNEFYENQNYEHLKKHFHYLKVIRSNSISVAKRKWTKTSD